MNRRDTFRLLCKLLSPVANNQSVGDKALVENADWDEIIRLANRGNTLTYLYPAINHYGLAECVPGEAWEFMATLHQLNRERNTLLLQSLSDISAALNGIDVEPLLLKGVLALLPDQFRYAKSRLMEDLDLLIPGQRLTECEQALTTLGYRFMVDYHHEPHHHSTPMAHSQTQVKVELHTAVTGLPAGVLLKTEEVRDSSSAIKINGANARVPTISHRLMHNLVHSQVQDGGHATRSIELSSLYEFSALRAAFHAEINWQWLAQRCAEAGHWRMLETRLELDRLLFSHPLPGNVTPGTRARYICWLSEQSFCHPLFGAVLYLAGRGRRLPKRLATPGWYQQKISDLRAGKPF